MERLAKAPRTTVTVMVVTGDGGDAIGSEGGRCERSLHPDARGDIGHIVVTKRSTLEFAWSLWDLECFCIRTFSF